MHVSFLILADNAVLGGSEADNAGHGGIEADKEPAMDG
jgi:hypothetical protein